MGDKMKTILAVVVGVLFVTSCGAEWAECETCKLGEKATESKDGKHISVVVNVDVNQTQNSSSVCTTCQPPTFDAGTSRPRLDAGTPPKLDAGVSRDAGCPPVCRKVCVCYVARFVCNDNRDVARRTDCDSCGVKREYKKCTKEEIKCS